MLWLGEEIPRKKRRWFDEKGGGKQSPENFRAPQGLDREICEETTLVIPKRNPKGLQIQFSFVKTSQSGALLRYSLHPEALMYWHTLELSLFIFQSFYLGDEDRKSYANNFILGRKKQLKTWIDLGHMFLGQQSQGVRSLLPPPEMLLPPPSSDLPIDELPETELDTSDDDKDEDEGECHFAHARQTTRGWMSDWQKRETIELK
jgi:hypothetical protein